jgi:hypothetical protein
VHKNGVLKSCVSMITIEEFKSRIRANEMDHLLDGVLLAESAAHVTDSNIAHVATSLSAKYGVPPGDIFLRVVGSAKLGFAINEKKLPGGGVLPRYRSFSPNSDIDIIVISPMVFDLVWSDLCSFAHRSKRLPWDSGQLGDYMVCGWLRPDRFPNYARLRRCDDWWDVFRALSADARYGRRKVRGGLFHSLEDARKYQNRALADCASSEAIES